MMRKSLARFREAGSFIAGTLVGLSIVVLVIASTGASPTDWQTFSVLGAPIILSLGITLQAIMTAKPRHQRTMNTAPGQRQDGLPAFALQCDSVLTSRKCSRRPSGQSPVVQPLLRLA